MRFSKRRCRWPVQLACGHHILVTDATLYSGWALCLVCEPATQDPAQRARRLATANRRIAARLRLTPAGPDPM